MRRSSRDPFDGFRRPDYDGHNVVNLLSSIIRSRGGSSPHAELKSLAAAQLASAQKLVYLVADGVGEQQLQAHLRSAPSSPFFGARPRHVITTVFPATTAAAVTTFATGATPAEHGILGWFLHLPDLGVVSTILLTTCRTGVPFSREAYDLKSYFRFPVHLDTIRCRRELISYGHIPRSRYSRAGIRWDRWSSCSTLVGLERQVAAFARRRGRALAYAYWPGYDTLCHEYGCLHPKSRAHLREIDASLARLVRRLRGTDTVLVVLADHGLVDTPPANCIDLRDVDGFYDTLAVIPSGDARQVQCFVRPAKVKTFLGIVRRKLSKYCMCVTGEDLLASGVLGPGPRHPALEGRVGDYMLLAKDRCALAASLPLEEPGFNVANHGGMSAVEMLIPLYTVYEG